MVKFSIVHSRFGRGREASAGSMDCEMSALQYLTITKLQNTIHI